MNITFLTIKLKEIIKTTPEVLWKKAKYQILTIF